MNNVESREPKEFARNCAAVDYANEAELGEFRAAALAADSAVIAKLRQPGGWRRFVPDGFEPAAWLEEYHSAYEAEWSDRIRHRRAHLVNEVRHLLTLRGLRALELLKTYDATLNPEHLAVAFEAAWIAREATFGREPDVANAHRALQAACACQNIRRRADFIAARNDDDRTAARYAAAAVAAVGVEEEDTSWWSCIA